MKSANFKPVLTEGEGRKEGMGSGIEVTGSEVIGGGSELEIEREAGRELERRGMEIGREREVEGEESLIGSEV